MGKNINVGPLLSQDPIDFWYPLAQSDQIKKNKLFSTKLFGTPLIIYRTSEKPVCFLNRCPHRGTPFIPEDTEQDYSLRENRFYFGSLFNKVFKKKSHLKYINIPSVDLPEGQIRCPLHGWIFNDEGKCIRVPTDPKNSSPPKQACLKQFPCQESDNLIWVNLNKEKASQQPIIWKIGKYTCKNPCLHTKSWILDVPVDYAVSAITDTTHVNQLHRDSIAFRLTYNYKEDEVTMMDYSDLENDIVDVRSTRNFTKNSPELNFCFFPPYYVVNILNFHKRDIFLHAALVPMEDEKTLVLGHARLNMVKPWLYKYLEKPYEKYVENRQLIQHIELEKNRYAMNKDRNMSEVLVPETDVLLIHYRRIQHARLKNINHKLYDPTWTFKNEKHD